MKKIICILLSVFTLAGLTSCEAQSTAQTYPGIPVLDADELKIIGTSPAVVDILDKLEIELIGVPSSTISVIPKRYENVTVIGTAMAPDMEIVKALNPDWILSPVTLISDLKPKYEAANINSAFLDLRSVEGMYKSIEQLGAMFDRKEQAKALT
ncbi:MAG: ABC transporter substrate-binding protein, partial [Oscillospiraceae bacterium]